VTFCSASRSLSLIPESPVPTDAVSIGPDSNLAIAVPSCLLLGLRVASRVRHAPHEASRAGLRCAGCLMLTLSKHQACRSQAPDHIDRNFAVLRRRTPSPMRDRAAVKRVLPEPGSRATGKLPRPERHVVIPSRDRGPVTTGDHRPLAPVILLWTQRAGTLTIPASRS